MKDSICLIVFCLLLTVFGRAQDESVKVIVLNEVLELVPEEKDKIADFQVVNIISNGKIIKKFSVEAPTFPQVVGTFEGGDADYVLYRTHMGQGACGRGSLYVIKFFKQYNPSPSKQIYRISNIQVSPVLSTCMGDGVLYSLSYSTKGVFTLTVAGHIMNLDLLDKWVEVKKPVVRKK